jgi:hypothetical protein
MPGLTGGRHGHSTREAGRGLASPYSEIVNW